MSRALNYANSPVPVGFPGLNATGHFDVWNGAVRYNEYFDKASKVYLWVCL